MRPPLVDRKGSAVRRFAAWMHDHRWFVLFGWIAIIVALVGVARVVGPDYRFDIEISGSESLTALELLDEFTPGEPQGDNLTVIWKSPEGALTGSAERVIEPLLAELESSPNVDSLVSPWDVPMEQQATMVAPGGQIATATVVMDSDSLTVPRESVRAIVDKVSAANVDGLQVGLAGQSVGQSQAPTTTTSEILGFAFAAVVLVLAFGSVLAAGLPLVGALTALAASLSVVTLLTRFLSIPIFAPQLVALIGIGVGIDYALFVVSRHRNGLLRGKSPREAMLDAMDTSGRAVMFAGVTVMISILGLLVVGIGFLNGLAFAVTIGVAFTMLVTVTLMPALLGFLGMRVLGRRARRRLEQDGPHDEEMSTRWGAWAASIQAKPWRYIALSLVVLIVMSIPLFSMRLGSADAGTDAPGSVTRVAYDLRSEGFGAGSNGPLLLVMEEGQADSLASILPEVKQLPNDAAITPVTTTPGGEVAFASVIPYTGPQEAATSDLIVQLREDVLPQASGKVYVSGVTAVFYDFASDLRGKLPWFLLGVLGLSSLLLMVAFRSIAIPVKAAVMNLLAAAATFGVLTAVFQWGWFSDWIGLEKTGPIDAFLPIMLLAILFGLSMDYQVFLVSRMKEEWEQTKDNGLSVRLGLAETGRVITAAALIMIFVFASFVFGGDRIIKLFGFGLAVAIFLDAFVIRSLLVPALMQVLGKGNWWLPGWLNRILPRVSIEPSLERAPQEEKASS